MRFQTLSIVAAASLASALTPPGFEPASQNQLFVQYGNQAALNGQEIAQASTQVQPTLATSQRLQGTYAVLMIDLDIPPSLAAQRGAPAATLLHWLQTGLTSSTQATSFNTSAPNATPGSTPAAGSQVFLLQNRQATAPLAAYFGPNPPAMNPLSHRYTFLLVDHSSITQQGLDALVQAASEPFGFDAMSALTAAGLANRVVAGNFFNVTNPGPAQDGDAGAGPGATPGAGPSGTDGDVGPSPTNDGGFVQDTGAVEAAGSMTRAGAASLCVGLAAALFWGL